MDRKSFTSEEAVACRHLIQLALQEDLGSGGDVTSQAMIPADLQGRAVFAARTEGVTAGLTVAQAVCTSVNGRLAMELLLEDGTKLQAGTRLAVVSGPMRDILAAERTALNFLQRLSGIASLTRRYVDAIAGLPCKILDTRKTIPGWRLLDKYAVRSGGGENHRMGLYDGYLIKDNHLAATAQRLSIPQAIQAARQFNAKLPIEIEVDTLQQLDEALNARPEIVLLDNMTLDQMREAVRRRNEKAPGVLLEASGGVTLATVRAIAETGVDRISVGALTHSAPALDIGLDYEGR